MSDFNQTIKESLLNYTFSNGDNFFNSYYKTAKQLITQPFSFKNSLNSVTQSSEQNTIHKIANKARNLTNLLAVSLGGLSLIGLLVSLPSALLPILLTFTLLSLGTALATTLFESKENTSTAKLMAIIPAFAYNILQGFIPIIPILGQVVIQYAVNKFTKSEFERRSLAENCGQFIHPLVRSTREGLGQALNYVSSFSITSNSTRSSPSPEKDR